MQRSNLHIATKNGFDPIVDLTGSRGMYAAS